jgi:hypothetical protein
MKNLFVLLVLLALSFGASAQVPDKMQTLFGGQGKTHHGFYFAPVLKVSSLGNETALFTGLKGAWTINRSVSLGFEGYGLAPTITLDNILATEKVRPLMGYGGFFIEPIIQSNKLIHLTIPVGFGAGWVGYVKDWEHHKYNSDYDYDKDDLVDDHVFWVIEPGVNAELNVAKFFRVGLGASYRITQDVKMTNTASDYARGMNYNLVLKFGRF